VFAGMELTTFLTKMVLMAACIKIVARAAMTRLWSC
jgi:hypothetical protein